MVSRLVLSHLDFESLQKACKVSRFWHVLIMEERSIWLKHFKVYLNIFILRFPYFDSELLEFLRKIEKHGTSQIIQSITQKLEDWDDEGLLWQIALFEHRPNL